MGDRAREYVVANHSLQCLPTVLEALHQAALA
jgi:hypothetical protein